jgi:hypothetical protein
MAKIIPFRKPIKPTAGEREMALQARIEQAVNGRVESDLAQFAIHLASTRAIWRQYPEMVEADQFPPHLVGPYHSEFPGDDPDDLDVDYGSPVIPPETLAAYREEATVFAHTPTARVGGPKGA